MDKTSNKSQLLQTDPRDALPHACRAAHIDGNRLELPIPKSAGIQSTTGLGHTFILRSEGQGQGCVRIAWSGYLQERVQYLEISRDAL